MLDAFYRAVLPAQGVYALFDGPRKRHIWCASLDELTRETVARGDEPDLYFATASFCEATERTIDNALARRAFVFDIDAGPAKMAKIEKRIAEGKAPESARDTIYLTRADALRALVAWCQSANLAPTYIIGSGAGLHVYFALSEDVIVDDWKPIADALKAKALTEGLRIDGGITGDPARILRPVGTLHNNGTRVAVLKHLAGAVHSLADLRDKLGAFVAAPKPERKRSLNADILEAPVGPPKTLAKVGERCAAMAHALQARGDVAEPYWRAMLGIIKFTIEGADAAHAHSEGHPEYDYHATQQKFDRWTAGPTSCSVFEVENPQACAGCRFKGKVKSPIMLGMMTDPELRAAGLPSVEEAAAATQQATEAAGPVEFQAFSDQDDDDGEVSLTAAAAAPAQPSSGPWAAHLPENYRVVRADTGCIMAAKRAIQKEAESGDKVTVVVDVPFSRVPFWFESWAEGTSEADCASAVFCVHNETRGTNTRFTFPAKALAARKDIFSTLASQNVQVYPNTALARDAMEDYVRDALERIRRSGQRPKIVERFGTMFDAKGRVIVAQGRHIINGDGTIIEGVVQEKLKARAAAYRAAAPDDGAGQWGPDVWASTVLPAARRHIDYLRSSYGSDNFRPYQLAIMLAWGSPMLAFMQGSFQPGAPLPGLGLTVSLYSPRSGIGKSAAMHAAALAFGVPSAIVLQLDRTNATGNARQGLLLQAGTMPSFMDEMEDVAPEDLASLISSVGNGMSKSRMDKTLQITGGVTTALVNVMSTNKSHRELVAADRNESAAVQMRMLEIDCSGVEPATRAQAEADTAARASIMDCAGAVGAMIHLAMCKLGTEQLNQLGMDCAKAARSKLNGQQDGRFMWRALGAMLAVRRILKSLGLQVFDGEALVEEFQRWHDAGYQFAQDSVAPTDGPALLSMMLADMAGKTLITHEETLQRLSMPLNDRVPEDAVARSVLSGSYVYVRTDAIREWAQKRRVSVQAVMAAGKRLGAFEPPDLEKPQQVTRKVDLFRGTKLSQGVRSTVVKVDLTKLGFDYEAPGVAVVNKGVVVELRRQAAGAATAAAKDAT